MKNLIITILAVLVLGLGGYLVYDKVIDKENATQEFQDETTKQEAVEAYELVDNAFSGIKTQHIENHGTAVQKVIVPKINKETEITKKINDKIYNNYSSQINFIKENKEPQLPLSFIDVNYDYTLKDNILFIKITSSKGVIDGGAITDYAVYYYDILNDKELSVEDVCARFNISKTSIKDVSVKAIYAIMPSGVYESGVDVFYTQDEPCPNQGCVGSEYLYIKTQ